jgi:hypothetical protein
MSVGQMAVGENGCQPNCLLAKWQLVKMAVKMFFEPKTRNLKCKEAQSQYKINILLRQLNGSKCSMFAGAGEQAQDLLVLLSFIFSLLTAELQRHINNWLILPGLFSCLSLPLQGAKLPVKGEPL